VKTTAPRRRDAAITAGLSLALGAGSIASGQLQNHWDRDPKPAASAEFELSDDSAVLVYRPVWGSGRKRTRTSDLTRVKRAL
jgi:hypothetical protein